MKNLASTLFIGIFLFGLPVRKNKGGNMESYIPNSRKWFTLFLLIASMSIVGCAATSNIAVIKPLASPIRNYNHLAVEMIIDDSKSSKYLSQLEGSIIGRLRELKTFNRVSSLRFNQDENYDLKLIIDVAKIRYVSSGMRAFVGPFAGQGALEINVKLVTQKDELLGESVIQGKSSAGTAFSGNTFQAVERVAEQVVSFIVNN